MNTIETIEPQTPAIRKENVIRIPLGLLGFERIKRYVIHTRPGEEPFQWLYMPADDNMAFLIVSPFDVVADYRPDISADDVEYLDLKSPEDALLYNIVTPRGSGRATINLKGPLVINRHTLIGKQVVLANASEFQLQHPIQDAV